MPVHMCACVRVRALALASKIGKPRPQCQRKPWKLRGCGPGAWPRRVRATLRVLLTERQTLSAVSAAPTGGFGRTGEAPVLTARVTAGQAGGSEGVTLC